VALKICQRGLEPEAALHAAIKGDFKPLPLGGVALTDEMRAGHAEKRCYPYGLVLALFCHFSALTLPDRKCKCDLALYQQEQDENIREAANKKPANNFLIGKECRYWDKGYMPEQTSEDDDEDDDEEDE
jgi:hypothetical protein